MTLPAQTQRRQVKPAAVTRRAIGLPGFGIAGARGLATPAPGFPRPLGLVRFRVTLKLRSCNPPTGIPQTRQASLCISNRFERAFTNRQKIPRKMDSTRMRSDIKGLLALRELLGKYNT